MPNGDNEKKMEIFEVPGFVLVQANATAVGQSGYAQVVCGGRTARASVDYASNIRYASILMPVATGETPTVAPYARDGYAPPDVDWTRIEWSAVRRDAVEDVEVVKPGFLLVQVCAEHSGVRGTILVSIGGRHARASVDYDKNEWATITMPTMAANEPFNIFYEKPENDIAPGISVWRIFW